MHVISVRDVNAWTDLSGSFNDCYSDSVYVVKYVELKSDGHQ